MDASVWVDFFNGIIDAYRLGFFEGFCNTRENGFSPWRKRYIYCIKNTIAAHGRRGNGARLVVTDHLNLIRNPFIHYNLLNYHNNSLIFIHLTFTTIWHTQRSKTLISCFLKKLFRCCNKCDWTGLPTKKQTVSIVIWFRVILGLLRISRSLASPYCL